MFYYLWHYGLDLDSGWALAMHKYMKFLDILLSSIFMFYYVRHYALELDPGWPLAMQWAF